MNEYTVTPLLLALIVGLAAMPTDIFRICAWNAGTLKIEPWRARAAGAVRAAATTLSWFSRIWRQRSVALATLVLLAALAGYLEPSAAALGMAGTVAEPTFAEVRAAIEKQNAAFAEFRRTNDERLAQLETKGVADPLLQAKLDRITTDLDKFATINEDFIRVQATLARIERFNEGAHDPQKRAANLATFNGSLRAMATSYGRQATELTMEQYTAYEAALDKYLRNRELFENERKALVVGSDPQGGYLVTPDKSGRMIERIFETSEMRQYASAQAISTDALEGFHDLEEASFGWVGETQSRSTNDGPNVPAPWRIPVHEAHSSPKATQKLLEDANVDVAQWLGRKVGDKMGRGFNTAWVTGNGIAKPRGFASYTTAATADAARAWGVFEHVFTGSNGAFGTDPNGVNKLLDLIHKMKDVYTRMGAFYMNRTTLGKIRQLTDASSAGKYVFIPSFTAGMPDTLLGYPVRKLQDMADYTTTDALAVAFGDMAETYQIVDRLGVTVLVDPFTAKPYVVFYTRARVGGDALNFDSMKFLKFGTS